MKKLLIISLIFGILILSGCRSEMSPGKAGELALKEYTKEIEQKITQYPESEQDFRKELTASRVSNIDNKGDYYSITIYGTHHYYIDNPVYDDIRVYNVFLDGTVVLTRNLIKEWSDRGRALS